MLDPSIGVRLKSRVNSGALRIGNRARGRSSLGTASDFDAVKLGDSGVLFQLSLC
jgi:hypothetical protein